MTSLARILIQAARKAARVLRSGRPTRSASAWSDTSISGTANAHVMRPRGSSGVWELFVPAIGAGTPYKYEIRARDARLFLKADPYGFAMQLRPDNCSIVHGSQRLRLA